MPFCVNFRNKHCVKDDYSFWLMGSNCKTLERFIVDCENFNVSCGAKTQPKFIIIFRAVEVRSNVHREHRQYTHCSRCCCYCRCLSAAFREKQYLFWLTPAAFRSGERKCSVRCDKLREMNANVINQIKFVFYLCRRKALHAWNLIYFIVWIFNFE